MLLTGLHFKHQHQWYRPLIFSPRINRAEQWRNKDFVLEGANPHTHTHAHTHNYNIYISGVRSIDDLSIALLVISDLIHGEKWISPKVLESSLFIPFLYYFYFNSSSARTIFIRLKLVWTCFWYAWTGRYPRQRLQIFYPPPFRKIIHFYCSFKLCNHFISFREPIYFSKQKNVFL